MNLMSEPSFKVDIPDQQSTITQRVDFHSCLRIYHTVY